jgi:hypothetical protein
MPFPAANGGFAIALWRRGANGDVGISAGANHTTATGSTAIPINRSRTAGPMDAVLGFDFGEGRTGREARPLEDVPTNGGDGCQRAPATFAAGIDG